MWYLGPLLLFTGICYAESVDISNQELLGRVAEVGRSLSYEGVFTYEHGGVMKAVKVNQQADNSGFVQQLLYLNGPRREIIRGDVCPFSQEESNLPALMGSGSERVTGLQPHYNIVRRGEDRVADRSIVVLQLVPKDLYRYGYVLGIDQQTGMLLQSLLISANNRVLERFQFIEFNPLPTSHQQEQLVQVDKKECASSLSQKQAINWRAEWLPAGFKLVNQGVDDEGFQVAVYSDGLSVFSIFVDRDNGEQFPDMQAQRGATIVQLHKVPVGNRLYAVSVVGEIPLECAQRIASQIHFQDS